MASMTSMTSSQSESDIVDITDDGLESSPSPSPPPPPKSIPTRVVRPVRPPKAKKTCTPFSKSANSPGVTISQEESCNIEKKCENPDCSAPTLISLVPTRSTVQFIHNPTVVPDPVLVNGYTTVFEVGGITANINDMKPIRTSGGKVKYQSSQPIFRVVPNTHAHIVNYVIIDAEGETLKKIKQNEPQTVKKLLESQKNSAHQLLEKLIGAKKNELQATNTGSMPLNKPVMKTMTNALPTKPDQSSTSTSTVPPVLITSVEANKTVPPSPKKIGSLSKVGTPVQQKSHVPPSSTPAITTPIISSVMSVGQVSQVSTGLPVVTNVESRNPAALPASTPSTSSADPSTVALERMQSELQALKETVKLLTEMKSASAMGSEGSSDAKKPRLT